MSSELESLAEKRGYGKGYTAGKRRSAKEARAEHHAQRNAAWFDRFMCAAMTGLLAGAKVWKTGEKADSTPADYADTAADIAKAMMRKGYRP